MKRLQKVQSTFKGEITAFLALIFILMLSIVGALIQSASIQITKSRQRADTLLALESVFAEYHQEMLERYDLFVRLGTSEEAICNRLEYYGADSQQNEVVGIELLSDDQGNAFYEQAVCYMKDWLGMEGGSGGIYHNFTTDSSLKEEEKKNKSDLEELLKVEQVELPVEDNPIENVEKMKSSSLLSQVVPDSHKVSNRNINLKSLASQRDLQKGNWENQKTDDGITEKTFFVSYLTGHFSNMLQENSENTLVYEQEYLLKGQGSDMENLEAVCESILDIRMAANYAYIQTDSAKKAEANAMAISLCSLFALPSVVELVKQAILFSWAYGESIVDVRALLKGKKVPAVKSSASWQLSLSGLVKLGFGSQSTIEKDHKGGLDYQTYLTGLLMLEEKETLCMRSLDLIESNLHIKADQCVTKLAIKSAAELRYGVQNNFVTVFGYQ